MAPSALRRLPLVTLTAIVGLAVLTRPGSAPAGPDLVHLLRAYSNQETSDGEHSTGYSVELFEFRGQVIGAFILHAVYGSPQRARLLDVHFDRDNGSLRFEAREPGVTFLAANGARTYGHAVYRFTGIAGPNLLAGTLEKTVEPPPRLPLPSREEISLPAEESSSWLRDGITYERWQEIFLPPTYSPRWLVERSDFIGEAEVAALVDTPARTAVLRVIAEWRGDIPEEWRINLSQSYLIGLDGFIKPGDHVLFLATEKTVQGENLLAARCGLIKLLSTPAGTEAQSHECAGFKGRAVTADGEQCLPHRGDCLYRSEPWATLKPKLQDLVENVPRQSRSW